MSTHEERPEADVAEPPEVSSFKLIGTLAGAGMLAGLLLIFVFQATAPRIAKYKKEQQEIAAREVLGGADRLEKLDFHEGAITVVPEGQSASGEVLFRGFDAAGALVGYALPGGRFGYADVIELMVGYAPHTQTLLGMKVLGNKETPGLGDGIIKKESYKVQFPGRSLPLVPTKSKGKDRAPDEVDTITGATISSTAVIVGINATVEAFAAAIETFEAQGAKP